MGIHHMFIEGEQLANASCHKLCNTWGFFALCEQAAENALDRQDWSW